MGFAERFKIITRNKKQHHPVAEVRAGRAAELGAAALLEERCGHHGFEYLTGVRVPRRKGRFEIDFVITTPDEIWAVELKNWSGFVGLDGGRVIQHRAGGRGVVDHGDLIGLMARKQRALERYLAERVDEPPEVWSVLVFANSSVALADDLKAQDDLDLVTLPELMSALPPPHYGKGLKGVDDTFIKPSIRQARRALAEIGTWDLVALHGGRILTGDVVGCSVEELYDRRRFRQLRVEAPRSFFQLFRRDLCVQVTARERDGERRRLEFGFDEALEFHPAGQRSTTTVALRDVVAVSYGYTSKKSR